MVLDPYFSGTKLAWLLDTLPGARQRAARGELAFGTIDTWLAWKLSGGALHVTDPSNASRTLLFDLHTGDWSDELLALLDVPRAVLPQMRLSNYGRIVNVVSVTGPVMAMRGEAAYATAKAALVGLTRSLALDEAQWNITVNAIAPGWIATGSQTEDEARQGLATPLKRSGEPFEIAGVIAMLCTEAASYLTGQCITVDGGNSIAEERA